MRKSRQMLVTVISVVAVGCAMLAIWFLLWPERIAAQALPPPPPPPDTPTHTATPTNTPIATNTNTPTSAPTPTNTPTNTAAPTATNSPTSAPTKSQPSQPTPTETRRPKATREPEPNPNCQAQVEGYVISAAGQQTAGATVTIEGTGWSNGMMTDDSGHYGFGGLCAGTATLKATLPNGQICSPATVNLDGHNSVRLDLKASPAGATGATPSPGPTMMAQRTPTPEPDMPTTGYSNWLLVGGALLGVLLLLSAGARRAFGSRRPTEKP